MVNLAQLRRMRERGRKKGPKWKRAKNGRNNMRRMSGRLLSMIRCVWKAHSQAVLPSCDSFLGSFCLSFYNFSLSLYPCSVYESLLHAILCPFHAMLQCAPPPTTGRHSYHQQWLEWLCLSMSLTLSHKRRRKNSHWVTCIDSTWLAYVGIVFSLSHSLFWVLWVCVSLCYCVPFL